MTVTTPTINRIIKMTEFDLLRTANTPGNMYMCVDSYKLYYDETKNSRVIYNYTSVKTINDLQHNITPEYGIVYYCWEDNSLWLWLNKWLTLWSDSTYPSAYVYDNNNELQNVYRNDQPLWPADDNGLLHDGSVVVRDKNRIIKGKIYVDDGNDNLIVSSYLGGGVRLLPNGHLDQDGELLIGDEGKSFLRSEMYFKNNQAYIDFSEKPELDDSINKKDTHKYMIYHEGNIDPSALRVMTPEDIYNKLLDPSLNKLKPFDFDVKSLGGRTADMYSIIGHEHVTADISNFDASSTNIANRQISKMFDNANGYGIIIDYKPTTNQLTLSTKPFRLSLSGGVYGYVKVDELQDTDIEVTVLPEKHKHTDYIERMDDLQYQITNINVMDPNDYYTIKQTDALLSGVKGTVTPTPGKPLLVNTEGILPAHVNSASKLTNSVTINFVDDITGQLITDFSSSEYNIKLNTENILSVTPTPGKALLVDKNNNLPGNAETSSALDHNIKLTLSGEATGSVIIDTNKDYGSDLTSVKLNTTLLPGSNILQEDDLGVRVASLDSSGKIPVNQIPAGANGSLAYMGRFNPSDGYYPSENPENNQYWVADETGILFDEKYYKGDWLLYQDDQWNHTEFGGAVTSVNGKIGKVSLTAQDVDAIETSYIDYMVGNTIPAGSIVITSKLGVIEGATVSALTNKFGVRTVDSTSDVIITNIPEDDSDDVTMTDGSRNMLLELQLSDNGINKIKNSMSDEFVTKIKYGSVDFGYKKYLAFTNNFIINENGDTLNIDIDTQALSSGKYITTIGDGSSKEFTITHNLNTEDIIVQFRDTTTKEQCILDNTIIDANTIKVTTNNILASKSIKVYICTL